MEIDRKDPNYGTTLGLRAEKVAADFLTEGGYRILEFNWQRPWGEVDIIAEKDDILVFVEVKASSADIAGFSPELRAGKKKMEKVIRAARSYLAGTKRGEEREWRIDVVSIVFRKNGSVEKIDHFENIDT